MQVACAVVQEVAEQPDGHALGVLVAGARERSTLAPRAAYSSGMIQACASAISATAAVTGLRTSSSPATATNGTVCATVIAVQIRPVRRSDAVAHARSPVDALELGQRALGRQRPVRQR